MSFLTQSAANLPLLAFLKNTSFFSKKPISFSKNPISEGFQKLSHLSLILRQICYEKFSSPEIFGLSRISDVVNWQTSGSEA